MLAQSGSYITVLADNLARNVLIYTSEHYMGDLAKARLEEVKKVMAEVQGGKYRWTWKKYKVAMTSMSCE